MYRRYYNLEHWHCNVQTIYVHLDNCIYMSKLCIYRISNICSCICNQKTCTEHVYTMSIPGYTIPNKFIHAANSPKHAIYRVCTQSKKV